MLRPASARAPLLITPETEAAPAPETDGEKDPLAPEPETDATALAACAEPVACPADWLGPFRAVPLEPVADWANDWADAPDMLRPDSARAPLLITPDAEARTLEEDGEKDPLAPEPETDATALAACAEPVACPADWLGLFRPVPRALVAAWAIDCEAAPDMLRPDSARAALLRTLVAAARVADA